MITETERHLAYAESQASHPDRQLQPLLALIYGPSLQQLRGADAQDTTKAESSCGASGRESARPLARPLNSSIKQRVIIMVIYVCDDVDVADRLPAKHVLLEPFETNLHRLNHSLRIEYRRFAAPRRDLLVQHHYPTG